MKPEKYDEDNLREEIIYNLLEILILADTYNIHLDEEIKKKTDFLYKKYGFNEK
jgi:NTP pyrophosphatase (non-canonical NTP hydrolase)